MSLENVPFLKINPDDNPKPWLPIIIINPFTRKRVKTYGLIDTGADECALPAQYAELLGHNLQKGQPKEIGTGNGITTAYSHTVSIRIDTINIKNVLIDFMPNLSIPLLGVKSFLSKFILIIDYRKQTFSLKLPTKKRDV